MNNQGAAAVASSEIGVDVHGSLKQLLREAIILGGLFAHMPQAALVSSPRVEAFWRLAQGAMQLSICNRWGYGGCHCLCDLILHGEDVGEIAVVALGPDVIAGFGLDQLRVMRIRFPALRRLPSRTYR